MWAPFTAFPTDKYQKSHINNLGSHILWISSKLLSAKPASKVKLLESFHICYVFHFASCCNYEKRKNFSEQSTAYIHGHRLLLYRLPHVAMETYNGMFSTISNKWNLSSTFVPNIRTFQNLKGSTVFHFKIWKFHSVIHCHYCTTYSLELKQYSKCSL